MSNIPEVLANREVCVVLTGLHYRVPMAHKPLLSSLACLPTVLRLARTSSVSLTTGIDVDEVGGSTTKVPLNGQVLTCACQPVKSMIGPSGRSR